MVTLNLTEEEAKVLEAALGLSEADGRAGEYLKERPAIVERIRWKLRYLGVDS